VCVCVCVCVCVSESDRVGIFSSLSFLRIWHGYDTVWYVNDVTSGVPMVTKSPSLRWTSFCLRDVTVRILMVMIARNEKSGGFSARVLHSPVPSTEPLLRIYRPIHLLGFPVKAVHCFHCICVCQTLHNDTSKPDLHLSSMYVCF